MSENAGRYEARGVSSRKEDVHQAIRVLDGGLFPGAFCKVLPDVLTGQADRCSLIHADGSGTKAAIAYLHYRETGDASVFRGIAQDSVVMNLDDLLCVGVTGDILLSSTINRNARRLPGECLQALIEGTESFLARLRQQGVAIHFGGGETADVGDLVGTVTVDSCAVATPLRSAIIDNARIAPGLAIVGLASDGQASYEDEHNSGIGSNGLTSARHDLLAPYYGERYPETVDPETPKDFVYCGPYKLSDPLPGAEWTVGQGLLSPTRTYAPIVAHALRQMRGAIKGIVHCSGGGQTKCLRFAQGCHFVKDTLFPAPPIFRAIQAASGTSWREMYGVYNMGHRLELYCLPEAVDDLLALARLFRVAARQVGEVRPSEQSGKNHLTLTTQAGERLHYAL